MRIVLGRLQNPFLQSYFRILSKDNIKEEDFIQIIENKLTKSLDKFQKCPLIHQRFRKDLSKITIEDKSFIEKMLEIEETKLSFSEKTIQRLKDEMKSSIFKSNETCYLFQLLLSLKNYLDFLKSDENRDDTYILPLLLLLDDINIVIFENIDDEIKIKLTDYTDSQKIGFIYKRGNYYEPILYRYYDKKVKEEYLLTSDFLRNGHYEIIFESILSKIELQKTPSNIEIYENILRGNGDNIQKLFIDNYSNVSYLITRNNKVVPIVPEPIPTNKKYEFIYSFLDIQDIKLGMKVKFGPKQKWEGVVKRLPFGKKGREKLGVISKEGKEYPNILCSMVCFLDNKVCMQMLPTYEKAIKYLSLFKEYFQIKSLIESEEGKVTTIVFSNDTYLPLLEEDSITTKYKRIQSMI